MFLENDTSTLKEHHGVFLVQFLLFLEVVRKKHAPVRCDFPVWGIVDTWTVVAFRDKDFGDVYGFEGFVLNLNGLSKFSFKDSLFDLFEFFLDILILTPRKLVSLLIVIFGQVELSEEKMGSPLSIESLGEVAIGLNDGIGIDEGKTVVFHLDMGLGPIRERNTIEIS